MAKYRCKNHGFPVTLGHVKQQLTSPAIMPKKYVASSNQTTQRTKYFPLHLRYKQGQTRPVSKSTVGCSADHHFCGLENDTRAG